MDMEWHEGKDSRTALQLFVTPQLALHYHNLLSIQYLPILDYHSKRVLLCR